MPWIPTTVHSAQLTVTRSCYEAVYSDHEMALWCHRYPLRWIPTTFTRATGGFPHASAVEFSAVAVAFRKADDLI